MKLISWNVNGLRAVAAKGFSDIFEQLNADIFCLQETKLQDGQIHMQFPGYESYWNYADKKGYSGTAIFTRHTPTNVSYGLGIEQHDHEGRLITLEFERFFLVNVYTPNAQEGLRRLPYRLAWDDDFRHYLVRLDSRKPVIACGDMNVAHQEIDLKNPNSNRNNAGFTLHERAKFTELLQAGFADVWRQRNPNTANAYTWWSYRRNARANNAGWRIDYWLVSQRLMPSVSQASILNLTQGSDHCPVEIDINL